MPNADDFRCELLKQIKRAENQGRPHIEINSGELHRSVGGYPNGGNHSMPVCCTVMDGEYVGGKDDYVFQPEKTQGASLTIRYALPR